MDDYESVRDFAFGAGVDFIEELIAGHAALCFFDASDVHEVQIFMIENGISCTVYEMVSLQETSSESEESTESEHVSH